MLRAGIKRIYCRLPKNFGLAKEYLEAERNLTTNAELKRNNFLFKDHSPNYGNDLADMLKTLGYTNTEELLREVIPKNVYDKGALDHTAEEIPVDVLHKQLKEIMSANKLYKTYIGQGFSGTLIPHTIERNFLSNPGWYTAYTPYQAEISQGRLEGLMIFQELTRKLTGFEISGASLLDEASAASEAMILSLNSSKSKARKYLVDAGTFPSSVAVMKTNARFQGIEVVVKDIESVPEQELSEYFGVLFQNPDNYGRVRDLTGVISKIRAANSDLTISVGTDLASLLLFKSPGEMGADVAFGNSQRFGVPLGFGGPSAAFMCTHHNHIRKLPGRIIGNSIDSQGEHSFRMALQTREQHIRREKATSNICTAQALLANMVTFYSIYHGETGLKTISTRIHLQTQVIAEALIALGFELIEKKNYFDTLTFVDKDHSVYNYFQKNHVNLRANPNGTTSISLDETVAVKDVQDLLDLFAGAKKASIPSDLLSKKRSIDVSESLKRKEGKILENPVFHNIKGEHEMMRYLKYLENKDISLTKSMITLGSCTMKLNAATEMIPLTWPEFNIHPFVPIDQAEGYITMINQLKDDLKNITKMDDVSFNPNSGATGEYAGLLAIRSYLESQGQGHRDICLIPKSAHGTNPASAARAGLKVVVVDGDEEGNICLVDLKKKCEQYKDKTACFMITYPSTHGVYEDTVRHAIDMIHAIGAQVYLDGANMNAQVGLTSPGYLGADVCHLNLHKTFCIPHGGGGPGAGPICVKAHLAPYVPKHNKKGTV